LFEHFREQYLLAVAAKLAQSCHAHFGRRSDGSSGTEACFFVSLGGVTKGFIFGTRGFIFVTRASFGRNGRGRWQNQHFKHCVGNLGIGT
jgi:hypothetical protein